MKLEEKKVFQLWQFQTPFFVCEKWLVIFVISKFFLQTNALKRSTIANDQPLYATLKAYIVDRKHLQLVWRMTSCSSMPGD